MSRKWIIGHFTRSFFGYDRFIMMFYNDVIIYLHDFYYVYLCGFCLI
nr:MAG TPA: hypothetical protein [Caudoviricetes sp.]